ncbi:MAG: YdeI/OmpD-associated family protein [Candidatus Eisenbacteria bacterium]|nr:YdeI/OmpD-associated family protein [Candidatus Eisenbacteria bacterium]MCC7140773.1 YdeI/OmpD-associated family protein [Candidatus Eisenbacteria bacterium]
MPPRLDKLRLRAKIERRLPTLPRHVVIPAVLLFPFGLTGTTFLCGKLNGVEIGRRPVKRWDDDRWILTITHAVCLKAQVDVGDTVDLVLHPAPAVLPAELRAVLEGFEHAREVWERMSEAQQRTVREEVAGGRASDTRARRARRLLGVSTA